MSPFKFRALTTGVRVPQSPAESNRLDDPLLAAR